MRSALPLEGRNLCVKPSQKAAGQNLVSQGLSSLLSSVSLRQGYLLISSVSPGPSTGEEP